MIHGKRQSSHKARGNRTTRLADSIRTGPGLLALLLRSCLWPRRTRTSSSSPTSATRWRSCLRCSRARRRRLLARLHTNRARHRETALQTGRNSALSGTLRLLTRTWMRKSSHLRRRRERSSQRARTCSTSCRWILTASILTRSLSTHLPSSSVLEFRLRTSSIPLPSSSSRADSA